MEDLPLEIQLQIEEWKDMYQAVFVAEINEIWFVFRGLSRAEFNKAMEYYTDDYDRAEYVCRLCVLDPEEFDYTNDDYAGIPETLAQMILKESGFVEGGNQIKATLQKYDQEMESFEHQLACVIAEVYPKFSLEEIGQWSMEKTLWHFSRAKWTLKTLRGIDLQQE